MSIASIARVYTQGSKAWTCKWQVLRRSCRSYMGEQRAEGPARRAGLGKGQRGPGSCPRLLPSASAEPGPCRAPGFPEGRGSPGAGREGPQGAPSWGSSPGERPAQADATAGEGDEGSSATPAGRAAGERSPSAEFPADSLPTLAPSLPSFLLSLLPSRRSLAAGKTCPQREGH